MKVVNYDYVHGLINHMAETEKRFLVMCETSSSRFHSNSRIQLLEFVKGILDEHSFEIKDESKEIA